MKFLSLYTSSAPPGTMPTPELMARMGELIQRMTAAGLLDSTNGIMNRSTGMLVTQKDGKLTVADGEIAGSSLMPASGYAIMNAPDRETLVKHLAEFMEVAGDGRCEIIQIMGDEPHG